MISRRQIIGQQEEEQEKENLQEIESKKSVFELSSSTSSSSSSSSDLKKCRSDSRTISRQQANNIKTRKLHPIRPEDGSEVVMNRSQKQNSSASGKTYQQQQQQQQVKLQHQQTDDRFLIDHHQDMASNYYGSHHAFNGVSHENNHNMQASHQPEDNYRHFDPYSVHGEEDEDVWYSEERLFEDHLDEIFNKWRLLDDDIWCKLIIMERNRRIGKAYARVPIVTIDGSNELSYDGYKLALNGFDNPERDSLTEECRKRIGKGIRIKMDNLGNIVIKRLSKAGVFVKDWLQFDSPTTANVNGNSNGASVMPSRQQLIRNQLAASGIISSAKSCSSSGSTIQTNSSSSIKGHQQHLANSNATSSGSSSMEASNDSAICDEILSLGGCLEQNQIYYLFDMKKFQANVTQELCRPYPDIRKLEQQCFSIIGLARDSEDILNLPIWVMVINIVAIEMLNERFPLMMDQNSSFPDTNMMLQPQKQRNNRLAPKFTSVFDGQPNGRNTSKKAGSNSSSGAGSSNQNNNKEEDPYSLPGNVSSSDVKSSINDYGTTSTRNISSSSSSNHHRYYQPKDIYAPNKLQPQPPRGPLQQQQQQQQLSREHRSKSNCNIYGNGNGGRSLSNSNSRSAVDRFNSSIYSPGHMLVQPRVDSQLPPKLPPRDLGKMLLNSNNFKSKSSSNVNQEEICSTGLSQKQMTEESNLATKPRKTKKNRFLDSLKAPLELAKGATNRSTSVLGAPTSNSTSKSKSGSSSASTAGFAKTGAKNFKMFLGVKSSKSSEKNAPETTSDDSNYIHLEETMAMASKIKAKKRPDSNEADSVVDSSEELLDDCNPSNSYNDLDIPTPDYETDENIYGLGVNQTNLRSATALRKSQQQSIPIRSNFGTSNKSKINAREDLYYTGFSAHIPSQVVSKNVSRSQVLSKQRSASTIHMEPSGGNQMRIGSRFAMSKLHNTPPSARDMIYGSTTGLSATTSNISRTRFRSASMQRNYPMQTLPTNRLQNDMTYGNRIGNPAELDDDGQENPYAMSSVNEPSNGTNHRRRSTSKSNKASMLGQPLYRAGQQPQRIPRGLPLIKPNGRAYRSYDSSNDSEPSYTNSSDGLDIYDHIGARMNHNHNQFLNDIATGTIAPGVHVGEWENMYDR